MFRFLLFLFILVPIIEIGVFIQVGDKLGLGTTIAIVIITAVIGVNLLKQQGFATINNIQNNLNQGKIPALDIAAGAQLLFAGGLLLTPGFVTDLVGFLLMIPAIRMSLARVLISRINVSQMGTSSNFSSSSGPGSDSGSFYQANTNSSNQSRVFEGELAEEEIQNKPSNTPHTTAPKQPSKKEDIE